MAKKTERSLNKPAPPSKATGAPFGGATQNKNAEAVGPRRFVGESR